MKSTYRCFEFVQVINIPFVLKLRTLFALFFKGQSMLHSWDELIHGDTSLDAAISKHDSHESINLITRNVTLTEQFRFKRVTHKEVLTRLTKINVKKKQ